MIQRGEIEEVAQELQIHTSHVQRDYVYGWLLSSLYSDSPLSKQLVLKGGNCLRKAYFKEARYSRDIDFSISTEVPNDYLGRELNALCNKLSDQVGIKFQTDRTRVDTKREIDDDKRVTEARLYFHDFFGEESEVVIGIRLDVTQFQKLYLPVQERQLIHAYSDSEACASIVRCIKLEELLATKMRCLLQRRHIADLYDLTYSTIFSEELEVNKAELLSTFFKITIFGNSPAVAKGLFIDLPLEALSQFWETYISCPKNARFTFEKAKENFLQLINGLIPAAAVHDRSAVLFPSSHRNPIMEAGQNLTLLRLRYDNKTRLVEPYSLVFKIRKDGVAREYLYAHDTTGGNSGPGMKLFVPGKVEFIENTDTPFNPRHDVELNKAGSAEISGRFEGHSVRKFRFGGWKQNHEIPCTMCGRLFRRSTFDTKLNPHKNKSGHPCFGRYGVRIS